MRLVCDTEGQYSLVFRIRKTHWLKKSHLLAGSPLRALPELRFLFLLPKNGIIVKLCLKRLLRVI